MVLHMLTFIINGNKTHIYNFEPLRNIGTFVYKEDHLLN